MQNHRRSDYPPLLLHFINTTLSVFVRLILPVMPVAESLQKVNQLSRPDPPIADSRSLHCYLIFRLTQQLIMFCFLPPFVCFIFFFNFFSFINYLDLSLKNVCIIPLSLPFPHSSTYLNSYASSISLIFSPSFPFCLLSFPSFIRLAR